MDNKKRKREAKIKMVEKRLVEIRSVLKKRKPHFIRKDSMKISKLGRKRKKKQFWRRPRGEHSKVRMKERGYLKQPSIGYSSPRLVRGLVSEKKPVIVYNLKNLNEIKTDEIAVLGKVGRKKKIALAEYALSKNIEFSNIDAKKFIEKINEEKKRKEEEKRKVKIKEEEKKKQEQKKGEKVKEEKKVEEKGGEKTEENGEEKPKVKMENEKK